MMGRWTSTRTLVPSHLMDEVLFPSIMKRSSACSWREGGQRQCKEGNEMHQEGMCNDVQWKKGNLTSRRRKSRQRREQTEEWSTLAEQKREEQLHIYHTHRLAIIAVISARLRLRVLTSRRSRYVIEAVAKNRSTTQESETRARRIAIG